MNTCNQPITILLTQVSDPAALKFAYYFRLAGIYVLPFIVLIPAIPGIFNYRKLSTPLRVIFYYLLFAFLMNLVNSVGMYHHQSSTTQFNIYVLGEFGLLSFFYIKVIKGKWQKAMLGLGIAFTIFAVVFFFLQPESTYPVSIESILMILYSLVFISRQNQVDIEKAWSDNSLNWINTGLLICFATTLSMFAFYNYLLQASITLMNLFWVFQDLIVVLEYTLFAIAFNKARTESGR